MKIWFERSGGFTGIPLTAEIDCDSLDPTERESLTDMVQEAGFFDLPDSLLNSSDAMDRFQYELTLEMEERVHTVRFGESGISDELRRFTQYVTLLAREMR